MKFIKKGPEPLAFSRWKALESKDWKPTYGALDGNTKDVVKTALKDEQGHICCYCERRLRDEDSHIEHFKPQSDKSGDPLDFNNMLCSCQNELKRGDPRHCGHKKADWFDENLLISPLDQACELRFFYSADGSIRPARADDAAAMTTIEKLDLNISKLIALRKKAIEPFIDQDLDQNEMRQFVEGYLEKDENGHYQGFWTTIKYLFRDDLSP